MKERCGADGISAMALWKLLFLFGMVVSPFKLRNLVSCPPALLEMLLDLCSTNNFSDFFCFFLWLWRHTKQPKYHIVYCARCFHGPKLSSTGVILNVSVRDGKVILACTLASDSPVSLGCDEYLVGSASKDVPPF